MFKKIIFILFLFVSNAYAVGEWQGVSVRELNDVDKTVDPADNYILLYDGLTELWVPTLASALGYIDGSGVTNYIPKFSDSNSLTISSIYELPSGNIGIGTTNPTAIFEITAPPANSDNLINISSLSTVHGDFLQMNRFGNICIGRSVFANDEIKFQIIERQSMGDPQILLENSSTGNNAVAGIQFRNSDSHDTGFNVGVGGVGITVLPYLNNIAYLYSEPTLDGVLIATQGSDPVDIMTNSTRALRVDSQGRVGIGTTNPTSSLQVNGTTNTINLLVSGNSSLNSVTASTVNTAGLIVNNESSLNSVTSYGIVDNKNITTPDLYITANASLNSTTTAGLRDNKTIIGVNLFTTGKVGIGITAPITATLNVNGDLSLQSGATVNEVSTDTTLGGNSDIAVVTEKAIKTYVDTTVAAGDYWTRLATSGFLYPETITDDVGIGTTAPTSTLEVNGLAKSINYMAIGTSGLYDPTAQCEVVGDLIDSKFIGNIASASQSGNTVTSDNADFSIPIVVANCRIAWDDGTWNEIQGYTSDYIVSVGPPYTTRTNQKGQIRQPLFTLDTSGNLVHYAGTFMTTRSNYQSYATLLVADSQYGFSASGGSLMFHNGSVNGYIFYHGAPGSETEDFRFDGSGWLGINDSSPDAKEEISLDGSTTNNAFMVSSNDSNDGDLFKITGTGKVGVGTTNPTVNLQVQGTISAVSALTIGNTNPTPNSYLRAGFGNTNPLVVRADNGGRVGIGTTAPAQALDVNGFVRVAEDNGIGITSSSSDERLIFDGSAGNAWFGGCNVGIGSNTVNANLHISGTNTPQGIRITANSDQPHYIQFTQANGNTNFAIGMDSEKYFYLNYDNPPGTNQRTILTGLANGNMGIGTTNPTSKLFVEASGNNENAMVVQNTSTGAAAASSINFNTNDGNGVMQFGATSSNYTTDATFQDKSFVYSSNAKQALMLYQGGSNPIQMYVNGSEAMRIMPTGKVGIGTTNPNYLLHVAGTINCAGVAANGSIGITGTISPNASLVIVGGVIVGTIP